MLKFTPALRAAACLAVAAAACTDATVIGGELVDGTQLPVTITDTIPLAFSSRATTSALANGVLTAGSVVVGCIESDATGRLNARLGLELQELARPRLDLGAITIDSAVLILPVIASVQVGDTTAATALRVRAAAPGSIRLTEAKYDTPLETLDRTYGTFDGVLPRRAGLANTFVGDSLRVDTVGPQVRIPLNADFLADVRQALTRRTPADTLVNDSLFVTTFPGIVVEGGEACAKTVPAVSLAPGRAPELGVTIYYRQDGKLRQFRLINRRVEPTQGGGLAYFGGYATLRPEYDRDISGSLLARLREGGPLNDSLAVVQALEGNNVRVTFPDLSAFGQRRGVTFAELEVPVAPGSDADFPALSSLVIQVENASGDLINYSARPSQSVEPPEFDRSEGGDLTTVADPRGQTDSVQVYRFILTSLFQDFVSGRREPTLYLVPRASREVGGQTVLLGPGAGQLRARLRVASTVLP